MTYWGNAMNTNQLLYFGVILDPRFKMKYIEWSFDCMYKDHTQFSKQLHKDVDANLRRMYNWYVATYGQVGQQHNQNQSASDSSLAAQTTTIAEIPNHIAMRDAFRENLRGKILIDKKMSLRHIWLKQSLMLKIILSYFYGGSKIPHTFQYCQG